MIFHASIEADDPRKTADAIARIWGAEAFDFPPVGEGSLIVLAGDDRGSAIEVYARGTALHPTEGAPVARPSEAPRHGAVHLAVATPLDEAEVFAIAAEAGWLAQKRDRGGKFELIEVWLDNCFMLEVLTRAMQPRYLASVTPNAWRAMLARTAPAPALA